ncbi:MAG: peptidase C45 [Planctomycetaceae bacterium]|nr:peptidase C45 [Planctomycetaceae bacterium]
MVQATRYRELTVSGPPRELGRQIGEAAREEVRGFCEVALERVKRTVRITREAAYRIARRSGEYAEKYRPDLVEELRGTAEAARVSLDDLLLLQVRNQLQEEKEGGCTSLSFFPAAGNLSGPIVAQNWDNDPALSPFTVVLTRRPADKPAFISCTQAGLISYMGFNQHGIGACINTLPAPSRDVGVPHYFILREIFERASLADVVDSVERAYRAIPVNIMLSTPQGAADLEVTVDQVQVLRPEQTASITHTNHCLHSDLSSINQQFPELIQSYSRKRRIDELVAGCQGMPDVAGVKKMLSDHDNHPQSICRHANEDPHHGFWVTVFSIIIEPQQRRMHISRGNPCSQPFEVYELVD